MIINQSGGGKKPTGTINITTNGTHDVSSYANADVLVPTTAPEYYIPLTTSGNEMLKGSITQIPSGGSATNIGQRVLYYAWYYDNTGTTQNVDWSGVTSIQDYGCAYALSYCSVVGSVDLSNLTFINSTGLQQAFAYSSITSLDLRNLETLSMGNAMGTACRGCTSLTSVNFNKLKTISGANAFSSTFRDCTALTSMSFPALQTITASLSNTFTGCSGLTSVSFPSLATINGGGTSVFSSTFSNCTSLTTFAFGATDIAVSGNNAFSSTFSGCTNLATLDLTSITSISGGTSSQPVMNNICPSCPSLTTVKFGQLKRVDTYGLYRTFASVSSLTTVTFDFPLGSTSTHTSGTTLSNTFESSGITTIPAASFAENINYNGFVLKNTFQNCLGLTTLDLSNIKTVSVAALNQTFTGCTNLTSVDLSNLESATATDAFQQTFKDCTSLASVNFAKLKQIGNSGSANTNPVFRLAFNNCTSLTSVSFPLLDTLAGGALQWTFSGCTHLANIYFNSLNSGSFVASTGNVQLTSIISGVTGCTLHFPSNLDPQGGSTVISSLDGYPNFGGTNTVLAFDLPATA